MFSSLVEKLMPSSPAPEPDLDSSDSDSDSNFLAASVEKSRKRHLSPGLLRGDRIADLLVDQEASASPSFKKTKSDSIPP